MANEKLGPNKPRLKRVTPRRTVRSFGHCARKPAMKPGFILSPTDIPTPWRLVRSVLLGRVAIVILRGNLGDYRALATVKKLEQDLPDSLHFSGIQSISGNSGAL